MFKNPITVTHQLKVDEGTLDAATERLAKLLKKTGVALAVGVPTLIVFAAAVVTSKEIIVHHATK